MLIKLLKKLKSRLFYVQPNQSLIDNLMNRNPKYSAYNIGEYSYGQPQILFPNDKATLKIGKYVSIANDVIIMLGGEHRSDWVSTYPFNVLYPEYNYIKGHPTSKGDVVIGNDVWIGRQALIMSGVTIGDGAIVAANAVVVKNVPPYSIVGGNPAKQIRFRFKDDEITELLRIKWWNWPDMDVKQNAHRLMAGDISALSNFFDTYINTGK